VIEKNCSILSLSTFGPTLVLKCLCECIVYTFIAMQLQDLSSLLAASYFEAYHAVHLFPQTDVGTSFARHLFWEVPEILAKKQTVWSQIIILSWVSFVSVWFDFAPQLVPPNASKCSIKSIFRHTFVTENVRGSVMTKRECHYSNSNVFLLFFLAIAMMVPQDLTFVKQTKIKVFRKQVQHRFYFSSAKTINFENIKSTDFCKKGIFSEILQRKFG